MEIKATLLPGQNGTKQLLKKYGDKLICVRYRYDKQRQKKFKTVELIVQEDDWVTNDMINPDHKVSIKIAYEEEHLRDQVKAAGGYWQPKEKAWRLPLIKVVELQLEDRVLPEDKNR